MASPRSRGGEVERPGWPYRASGVKGKAMMASPRFRGGEEGEARMASSRSGRGKEGRGKDGLTALQRRDVGHDASHTQVLKYAVTWQ